jgi:hypothetical protein
MRCKFTPVLTAVEMMPFLKTSRWPYCAAWRAPRNRLDMNMVLFLVICQVRGGAARFSAAQRKTTLGGMENV